MALLNSVNCNIKKNAEHTEKMINTEYLQQKWDSLVFWHVSVTACC